MSRAVSAYQHAPLAQAAPQGYAAAFLGRVDEVDVDGERDEILSRLEPAHRQLRQDLAFQSLPLATAEQVHGNRVAIVDTLAQDTKFPGVDGLLTNSSGIVLGIYVADCAAVYLFDRKHRALGLIHSGKVGTELGITVVALTQMEARFGSAPKDIVAAIAPCIRPPHYEIDFAAVIRRQLQACGVEEIHDEQICTASHPELYYSYRREKGRTGRMLALAMISP